MPCCFSYRADQRWKTGSANVTPPTARTRPANAWGVLSFGLTALGTIGSDVGVVGRPACIHSRDASQPTPPAASTNTISSPMRKSRLYRRADRRRELLIELERGAGVAS